MSFGPVLRLATVAVLVWSCAPGTTSPAATTPPPAPVASAPATPTTLPLASPEPSLLPSATPSSAGGNFEPIGLAVGPDGRVYVSDCNAGRVYRVEASDLVVVAGTGSLGFAGDGGPATSAELDCPTGLTFDRSGTLFIVDHANNRVRRIDRFGVISTIAGSGPTGPQQGAFSGDGGTATSATLRGPWGITVDRSGNLFVSDRDNGRIRRIDSHGIITTFAGNGDLGFSGDGVRATRSSLDRPLGMAVDRSGNLFVADENNNRVRRIDAHGIITTIAGTGDHASYGDGGQADRAAIADTQDVVLTTAGELIVSESEGHRLRRIDGRRVISTLAGTGQPGRSGDGGPAASAMIDDPGGLAIDARGTVFVADRGNHCIRAIDPNGLISSVWCG